MIYSIKELCTAFSISQPTFYKIVRENSSFAALVETHREKKGNSFHYDEAVFAWLKEYFSVPADTAAPNAPSEAQTPSEGPVSPSELDSANERIIALTAENEALKADMERTRAELEQRLHDAEARFESTESERKALLLQNSQLVMLLGQEKQEKLALLPSPKKPLIDRIRDIFKKD